MVRNFVLGLIVIVAVSACQKEKPKEVVLEAQPAVKQTPAKNEMPNFNVTKVDGTPVAFKEVSGKTLVVFFNPSCDHCQREAKLLSENKDVVKDYQVYFISPEPMDSIAKFSNDYKLIEPNIHFAQGNGPEIINAVGPITTVPTLMVYDNQAFIARMEGEVSIEKLRQMLK